MLGAALAQPLRYALYVADRFDLIFAGGANTFPMAQLLRDSYVAPGTFTMIVDTHL